MNKRDFRNAASLDLSRFGGNLKTMTYALEHERAPDVPTVQHSATTVWNSKWPKTGNQVIIPYTLTNRFNRNERAVIASAFSEFHKKTCIK